MRKIDIETWPRRAQYELASRLAFPFYHVAFPVDVTPLRAWCRAHGEPFYFALVYLAVETMNGIENFRYRIRNGEVWLIDRAHPSFTTLGEGDLFRITSCRLGDEVADFCRRARELSGRQTDFINAIDFPADELVYVSCLPWMEVTAVSNERDDDPDDSIPRISWGRFAEREGRLSLNMTLEVNHRLIDGVHIGRFANRLQQRMDALGEAAERGGGR